MKRTEEMTVTEPTRLRVVNDGDDYPDEPHFVLVGSADEGWTLRRFEDAEDGIGTFDTDVCTEDAERLSEAIERGPMFLSPVSEREQ
jgi:hypothetical protein